MTDAMPRILIVDDTPQNIALLEDILAATGAELLAATHGQRALELAARLRPDLILLDVMMPPGIDGFEVCRRLKADPSTAGIPVIFVTARTDDVAQGFAVGGVDYITKPVQADEVRARVGHQLERLALLASLQQLNRELEERVRDRTAELTRTNLALRQEVQERRYMQDRLAYLASHDFVTRLHNRQALDEQASLRLARLQTERSGSGAVMMLIDIDQFRLVNDSCGCIAGDELLRQFADLLAGVVGREDFLARLGADQFALLAEDRHGDAGAGLARLILEAVGRFEFRWNGQAFRLQATVAIVPLEPAVVSFDALMQRADETALRARREGRARGEPCWYRPGSGRGDAARDDASWALTLMDALRHERFSVWFQRLQPLRPPAGEGAMPLRLELLLRLHEGGPDGPLIEPGRFIAQAERFHLIEQIDRWVLRRLLQLLAAEPALCARIDQITLNLSAVTLREPGLAADIARMLAGHPLRPQQLCFEITETEAIVNLEQARQFMRTLQALGCRFSLDDFGSGYASFAHLRELPFDTLKIDGLFVRHMDEDADSRTLVRSMVEMARQLDKPVVAEFVESEPVARLLADLGVEWAQGYHFHRPEPLTVAALVAA
ncbi:putative bifunctional diguanylate cyclase/phosphodiesterase [Pseudaquabacterium rugosum]|jgi:diguanylate cyclase (GGDEF)-like protein|uniref:EAL domain-containing protein n=1 Tax=Pseudaquabacterium rugosum TaxID=2984194 RepID=A0ABU9BBY1_9BURK